ncbi:BAR/IMD domain-containing adapter protein 2-like isoform X2 [Caretta caretta]|uniref:BAR/IMD domain-containing adapter protein 2-like isoform X2 n=1 Tax=Caretta caretta TaxID=8467 RepID=UPI002095286D|nr:brain-specific angiogenesis inhibitor 1-associated protein 2-like isoform X2 [Caretta caretta]
MSRSDEVNRLTESVYRVILDQFNPGLRSFVTMGKSYQRALSGVTVAAKGYFDALVKLGELASDSQGSKELGDTLFQMAEVHRQIQVQLEETLKLFHSELLAQLEQKLELDVKYLLATLKKYQSEHRAKVEAIEKCQAELKKLRKKCQSSKNPQKYGDREVQYVEVMSAKQSELDCFVAEGYKGALTEERRRYSFLVDRQCAVSKHFGAYHAKVKELLGAKLPGWQQSCVQPTRLPDRALALVKQTANSPAAPAVSDPLPAPQPLEVPPELAPLLGGGGLALNHRVSLQEATPLPNGDSHRTRGSRDLGPPPAREPLTVPLGLPAPQPAPATQTPPPPRASDSYSCTLPIPRKASAETRLATLTENRTLPRSGVWVERRRVQAVFSHAPGESSTLLNFQEGDVIALLVAEARDGWHYGENEATHMKGWFPFSYTRPVPPAETPEKPHGSFPLSKLNSCSTGTLDKAGCVAPSPEGGHGGDALRYTPSPRPSTFRQRPYSMMNPDLSQLANEFGSPLNSSPSRSNPFAHVRLKRTVTNDRSAPLIQ